MSQCPNDLSDRPTYVGDPSRMDARSEVLSTLHLASSLYCRSELTAPRGLAFPAGDVAVFHAVCRGTHAAEASLSKAFKRYVGVAPGAFRRTRELA